MLLYEIFSGLLSKLNMKNKSSLIFRFINESYAEAHFLFNLPKKKKTIFLLLDILKTKDERLLNSHFKMNSYPCTCVNYTQIYLSTNIFDFKKCDLSFENYLKL